MINPVTQEGAPSWGMINEALLDAYYNGRPEADDLAMLVRRLVVIVRKNDPENDVAKKAIEFLRITGNAKTFSRSAATPQTAKEGE